MMRFVRFAAAVAMLILATVSCENFKNVTAEVPIDTEDKVSFSFDLGTELKKQSITYVDPISGNEQTETLAEIIAKNDGKLPPGIIQDVKIAIPVQDMPSEVTDNPAITPYKNKIYNVRIDGISVKLEGANTLPITLDEGLMVIVCDDASEKRCKPGCINPLFDEPNNTQEVCKFGDGDSVKPCAMSGDIVGVFQVPASDKLDSETGTFAPGGQDAASDMLASLEFKIGILTCDKGGDECTNGSGKYTPQKITIKLDSTANPNIPTGVFKMTIRIKMVFRVAPLA